MYVGMVLYNLIASHKCFSLTITTHNVQGRYIQRKNGQLFNHSVNSLYKGILTVGTGTYGSESHSYVHIIAYILYRIIYFVHYFRLGTIIVHLFTNMYFFHGDVHKDYFIHYLHIHEIHEIHAVKYACGKFVQYMLYLNCTPEVCIYYSLP